MPDNIDGINGTWNHEQQMIAVWITLNCADMAALSAREIYGRAGRECEAMKFLCAQERFLKIMYYPCVKKWENLQKFQRYGRNQAFNTTYSGCS